jgi:hypothetical protein
MSAFETIQKLLYSTNRGFVGNYRVFGGGDSCTITPIQCANCVLT